MTPGEAALHAPETPDAPHRAVIALGGNIGDRVEVIRRAMTAIDEIDGVRLLHASSMYETPALTLDGVDESAPQYLNAVVIVETDRAPEELLADLHRIEDRFGRQRIERWGSRTLDLDLIDVDGLRFATEQVELPHPRAWQRAFVLAPWHEVEPDAHLAGHGTIADLLGMANDRVVLFAESGMGERSPENVSSDRGLPLIGPDSQADPPRAIRGGGSGFGSGMGDGEDSGTGTGTGTGTGAGSGAGTGTGTGDGLDDGAGVES